MLSLNELVTTRSTRAELIEALTPKYREIHLDVVSNDVSELETSIKSTISLVAHTLEDTPVVLVFSKDSTPRNRKRSRINFPFFGKHPTDTIQRRGKNVAEFLTLLRIIHSRIKDREISTIRDVFYSNVELFRSQQRVTHWLKILATNFRLVSRAHLNIVPAQKGLFYCTRPLLIEVRKEQEISVFEPNNSQLIPYIDKVSSSSSKIKLHGCQISRVIVLEKEAVYSKVIQQLSTTRSFLTNNDATLVITGKGYPDTLTKIFLRSLAESEGLLAPRTTLDIYADADPDGLNIALIYMLNCSDSRTRGSQLCRYRGVTLPQLIALQVQLMNLTQRDIGVMKGLFTKCQPKGMAETRVITKTDATLNSAQPLWVLKGAMLQLQRQMFFGKKGEMNAMYRSLCM